MMAAPVYFPADREIGEPEIPAVDRVVAFTDERSFLLRESTQGDAWFACFVYGLLAVIGSVWIFAFAVASRYVNATRATEKKDDIVRITS